MRLSLDCHIARARDSEGGWYEVGSFLGVA
jgi:hypothetical protein